MSGIKDKVMQPTNFYQTIKTILKTARDQAYKQVNFIMVEAYWNIGKQIVEEEQHGEDRAKYGAELIKELSRQLTVEFGKGYSTQSLWNIRQFYKAFPILSTLCRELSWSHYRLIMRLENPKAREWYISESVASGWSVRALERQIHTHYYERLLSSKEQLPVREEATANTRNMQLTPKDIIKDPYVLEFLDLRQNDSFYESDLESGLIARIQEFLLELGRGFAFVARQKRIQTDNSNFYIDLVFYNYILKCFVLIDLKIGQLTHQDVGQMDMYVRMYDDLEKSQNDNPTIGLILCSDKDDTVVKYSVLSDNQNLFASKYQLYLPTEEELKREVEKDILELKLGRVDEEI